MSIPELETTEEVKRGYSAITPVSVSPRITPGMIPPPSLYSLSTSSIPDTVACSSSVCYSSSSASGDYPPDLVGDYNPSDPLRINSGILSLFTEEDSFVSIPDDEIPDQRKRKIRAPPISSKPSDMVIRIYDMNDEDLRANVHALLQLITTSQVKKTRMFITYYKSQIKTATQALIEVSGSRLGVARLAWFSRTPGDTCGIVKGVYVYKTRNSTTLKMYLNATSTCSMHTENVTVFYKSEGTALRMEKIHARLEGVEKWTNIGYILAISRLCLETEHDICIEAVNSMVSVLGLDDRPYHSITHAEYVCLKLAKDE